MNQETKESGLRGSDSAPATGSTDRALESASLPENLRNLAEEIRADNKTRRRNEIEEEKQLDLERQKKDQEFAAKFNLRELKEFERTELCQGVMTCLKELKMDLHFQDDQSRFAKPALHEAIMIHSPEWAAPAAIPAAIAAMWLFDIPTLPFRENQFVKVILTPDGFKVGEYDCQWHGKTGESRILTDGMLQYACGLNTSVESIKEDVQEVANSLKDFKPGDAPPPNFRKRR